MSSSNAGKTRTSIMAAAAAAPRNLLPYIFGGVALTGFGVVMANSLYNVDAGTAAVMYSRISGVRKEVILNQGTHFKLPFIEYPTIYDIRPHPHLISSVTGSKDLQMVSISLRLLAKPNKYALPTLHRTIGEDWAAKVLPSIAHEVLKGVIAKFNAAQLVTKRSDVSLLIGEEVRARAAEFNIEFDDVSLVHISFSGEYSKAVEEKKIAQQEAERALILVEKAKQEREETRIRAQGQAKSAELIGIAARNNPGYLELLRLDNAKAIAHAIAKSQNKVYLNADNLLLDLLTTNKVKVNWEQKK